MSTAVTTNQYPTVQYEQYRHDAKNMVLAWFKNNGWAPWQFQQDAWEAYLSGQDGLIHVPTGSGKTYAALFGPIINCIAESLATGKALDGLQILYITPLKSLSRDLEKAINHVLEQLPMKLTCGIRTGDTSSYLKTKYRKNLPNILITTPESCSLLISYPDNDKRFGSLKTIIVDEWHELLGSKRGALLQLSINHLKKLQTTTRVWGMTATVGNIQQAAQAVVGTDRVPSVIEQHIERPVNIYTLLPDDNTRYPWAGHLGMKGLPKLIDAININESSLVFTNTRNQAEQWFSNILEARPEWAGLIALHHGSMEMDTRRFVEDALKTGQLKLVVATSSLDLGVDFPKVSHVFQIGSPRSAARLLQRAGRANHQMGRPTTITCLPTSKLELLELAAIKHQISKKLIEPRPLIEQPLDVLAQHLTTLSVGDGFKLRETLKSVKTAMAYKSLDHKTWKQLINMLINGGDSLAAYEDYKKIIKKNNRYIIANQHFAKRHRMNIGTISSDSHMTVKFLKGKPLGQIEESYISKLTPGDTFYFTGRALQLCNTRDSTAYVKLSRKKPNTVPRWAGGRLPLSDSVGRTCQHILQNLAKFEKQPEIFSLRDTLKEQKRISALPKGSEYLVETWPSREGYYCFIYPFRGRMVNEGLAHYLASTITETTKTTFSIIVNDYGFALLSQDNIPYRDVINNNPWISTDTIPRLKESINLSDMMRRQFRDVARISGLTYQNFPGHHKTQYQLQSSAGLIYDVFKRYDKDHILLQQTEKEVLDYHFQSDTLTEAISELSNMKPLLSALESPSPLCFGLLIERVKSQLGNESLADKVAKLEQKWLNHE
jgi:ATP-dependent Lhr-like helicase